MRSDYRLVALVLTERPTQAWVFQELERRRSIFAPWHAAMDEDEDYYRWSMDFRDRTMRPYLSGLPPKFRSKLPPLAYLAV